MWETWVPSLGWEGPLEQGMATHSVFLPGEFHGQWSLAGYHSWGRKKSYTTEQLTLLLHFQHSADINFDVDSVLIYYAATAKSLQSSLTLCESRDSSPPGFPVPGILQARTLEWVAISFSNA